MAPRSCGKILCVRGGAQTSKGFQLYVCGAVARDIPIFDAMPDGARRRRSSLSVGAKAARRRRKPKRSPAVHGADDVSQTDESLCVRLDAHPGDGQIAEKLEAMSGRAWALSAQQQSCRAIQNALLAATATQRAAAINEFRGHVLEACASPRANFVLQLAIEITPCSQFAFVVGELRDCAAAVACQKIGCRVVLRLLEHAAAKPMMQRLIHELLDDGEILSRARFGRYVMQGLLEHGSATHRRFLAEMLGAGDADAVFKNACHKHASHVVEAAIVHCAPEDGRALRDAIASRALPLARSVWGSFVLSTALANGAGAEHARACASAALAGHGEALVRDAAGKRVVEALRKFGVRL